ncbi:MAG: NUDIX domain-containing protein [Planctomycetes bacterium]|nr:NUDIX domain-containing protein [Planctomycetota bacterium]
MTREKLHLTVAAVVAFQGRFLLVEEMDPRTGRRVLNQPAGHVEAGEDLLSSVRRELREETGLELRPDFWLGLTQYRAPDGHSYLRVNFAFEPLILPESYRPEDPDILGLRWLEAEALLAPVIPLRSPLVREAVEAYRSGIRLPLQWIGPIREGF